MRKYKLSFVIIPPILVVILAGLARAAGPVVTTKMLLSADKLRPGDSFRLAVQARVQTGLHVGAHGKDASTPTVLKLHAPKGIKLAKPQYPEPIRKAFPSDPGVKIPVYEGTFTIFTDGRVARDAEIATLTIASELETQACGDDQCYLPEVAESRLRVRIVAPGEPVKQINRALFGSAVAKDEAGRFHERFVRANALGKFALLYVGGLILAFTPCVYPMIPVTVGYFSAQSESKKGKRVVLLAAFYVLGLALTYSILGAIAATTGGVFGAAMQNPYVTVGISVLLVLLALSMFGLYELRAPSFVLNRSSGRSGIPGALVMGLIFGIVAAPCVGPPVLTLLPYVARIGSPVMGFAMFFVLSLGIGTPLFCLAAFSAKMPVPGAWMVAVKKLAGFLLLGAAAYFALPVVPASVGHYLMPAVLVAAGIYLGLFEKSLRTSRLAASAGMVFGAVALVVAVFLAIPHGEDPEQKLLKWEPYSPAKLQAAAQAGQPVMIDFTADWCVYCKKLERESFTDPRVVQAAHGFRALQVDATNRSDPRVEAARKRFAVAGFPAVIFVDSTGNEAKAARVSSFIDADELLKRIEMVE